MFMMLAGLLGLTLAASVMDFSPAPKTGDPDEGGGSEGPDGGGDDGSGDGGAAPAIEGTPLEDILGGGEGDDTVLAGEGDDQANGRGGDDWVEGGAGADALAGEAGDDSLFGGAGDDTLQGGAGGDRLEGGEGDDDLFGWEDDDSLAGGAGADSLSGGAGDDSLSGGEGDDALHGWTGDDSLEGGAGRDTLQGGEGADLLDGRERVVPEAVALADWGDSASQAGAVQERDFLNGCAGEDTLFAGAGDWATGGGGADSFLIDDWLEEPGGPATIADFDPDEDSLALIYDPALHPDPQIGVVPSQEDASVMRVLLDGHVVAEVLGAPGLAPGNISLVPKSLIEAA